MSNCPICGNKNTEFLLSLQNMPIKQNEPLLTDELARNVEVHNLNIYLCKECTFVFNATFNSELIKYTDQYNNNQLHSPFFKEYIESLIEKVSRMESFENKIITEIGCGKGDFLKIFSNKYIQNRYYGFDTTYEGEELFSENLIFYKEYFSEKYKGFETDIIISRHVIEHIHKPKEFLEQIINLISKSTFKELYLETPNVQWIFENNAFWDFFYEHCSYFSPHSLSYVLHSIGLDVSNIQSVFNGQYLWVEASLNGTNNDNEVQDKSSFLKSVNLFLENYNTSIKEWKKVIESNSQTVAVWGAGAKGVTFLNLIDPNKQYIKYAIDINPNKQGKYIPVTGHQIISPEQIPDDINLVIVMNPNYENEIKNICNSNIKIVNLN